MVAAYLGADITGDLTEAHRLIENAEQGPGGSPAGALAAAALMTNRGGDIDTIHRLLVGAIKGVRDPSDPRDRTLIEALYVLQAACAFGSRPGLAEEYFTALEHLDPEPPEFLVLLGSSFVEPARRAASTLTQLEAAIAGIREQTDHAYVVRIGIASIYTDRVVGCRAALEHVLTHGRAGGAITSAIEAFVVLGYDCLMTGEWDLAQRMTTEGLELAARDGYTILSGLLHFQQAYIAAARGEYNTAKALSDNIVRWAAPNRIGLLTHYAAHTRALAELGRGDYEAAYHHALTVCHPGTVPTHAPHALWVILELVEAAVRAGRSDDAARHVAEILDANVAAISPRLALVTASAQAMVAPPERYRDLFDMALAVPDADRWPFQQARIQLAYAERLRRAKATTEARRHLATALDTFDRLQAAPWATRARTELRATGQPANPPPASVGALTPQQREIALLAASGLTNKQIGERLYLSPRTVGTHLYQVFPKLGVTSRAALRDALNPRTTPE
ncbi:helix-turn-helix transcriptional regulator [Nocardia pseudobrasiliensis]|uniref:Regulatory LuxR family protein n=1 Tax=Nocardia pseudobrasiliensis TaxID=45979 RepID=A0A370HPJ7_9NOCA|nr:LuxR family transcriptional regulator [Nocardia pseudobrasiliensis]RDI60377.1 regulatory LuxR family protein [Nocardia pseudobrasiliensis]